MDDAKLAALNPAQREAVLHVDGPLLVLAGPGSGKTRVVTHRIAHLLDQGIQGRRILALTFTNKAADEMRRRVEALAPGAEVWMGTFHRFCARQLRKYAPHVGLESNYTIYDMDDSRRVLKQCMDAAPQNLKHATVDQVAHEISWAKNNQILPEQYTPKPNHHLGAIVAALYPAYQQQLRQSNAVDFDDLLLYVAALLRENPELRANLDSAFRYILVDEYQDTNLAQYAIVRALSIDHPNLCVTGDPDQSIYGWRGANVSNILSFEEDYRDVRVVKLEQNYRSTRNILAVADALIAHNVRRKRKRLLTNKSPGETATLAICGDHLEEADGIALRIAQGLAAGRRARDYAIIYRVNALSRSIETALRRRGINYQVLQGHAFYQRKEIKDLLAYLHLINNPRNDIALARIINTPARGIGAKTVQRLTVQAEEERMPLFEAARQAGINDGIARRTAIKIAQFVAFIDRLSAMAHGPVEELLGLLISETGYRKPYEDSEAPEDRERLENIDELLSAARDFDSRFLEDNALEAFLEDVSLVSDVDAFETEVDAVALMTMHAAKGLEFPVVFIAGVEDGILPHERSQDSASQYEEERRLLFVGVTRAEEELHLSQARRRNYRGSQRIMAASPFLMEIGSERLAIQETETARLFSPERMAERMESRRDQTATRTATRPKLPALTTAADLGKRNGAATEPAGPATPPEAFSHGMIVNHPEYGSGEIIALSGSGAKRQATVRFHRGARQRKFVLAFSHLAPVHSPEA